MGFHRFAYVLQLRPLLVSLGTPRARALGNVPKQRACFSIRMCVCVCARAHVLPSVLQCAPSARPQWSASFCLYSPTSSSQVGATAVSTPCNVHRPSLWASLWIKCSQFPPCVSRRRRLTGHVPRLATRRSAVNRWKLWCHVYNFDSASCD